MSAESNNGVRPLVAGPRCPVDGDLLKYSVALGGWYPTSLDGELAAATHIGIYTLPVADGNNGDVLSTNGAGALAWVAP